MTKKLSKKIMSLLVSLAILIGCVSVIGISSAFASDFKEGTYTGVIEKESMGGIVYTISAAFGGGKYSYDVRVQVLGMDYDEYDDTETGTYTVNGSDIAFEGGNLTSAEITAEGKLAVTGVLSSFAFGKSDSTELTWTSDEKPSTGNVYEDNLKSGKYELTADSYPENAMMKMDAIITIDAEAKAFSTQRNGAEKGTGTISFDENTGVYTVTYTEVAPQGATVTFTYGADGITFTSPLYFGSVKMNTLDDDGNFIPYTAKEVKTYEDNLKSGKYELTEDSFDSSAMMKMPSIITIDAEAKTFSTQDNRPGKEGAEKGTGTISFDETTGVYTVTYTADTTAGTTTTFTYENDAITFTSAMRFGIASINTLDEDGNFIPYTANLVTEPETETYSDNLKSGKYELTEDSFDSSAMMKMPSIITIDAEAKTFSTQDNRPGKEGAQKGTGTISFDETTGVYTVTYTADTTEGTTATFVYENDAITFTSAMRFGIASINTLDEDGNFIPYTANLITESSDDTDVTTPDDTDVTTPDDTEVTTPDNTDVTTPDDTDVTAPADNDAANSDENTSGDSNTSANGTSPATGSSIYAGLLLAVAAFGFISSAALVVYDRKKKALNK
ncbi:MAG: hypothetical protein K2G22_04505 [Eubacterium sp.]|nr:hypothetical protein [Eubacterium sp.]